MVTVSTASGNKAWAERQGFGDQQQQEAQRVPLSGLGPLLGFQSLEI